MGMSPSFPLRGPLTKVLDLRRNNRFLLRCHRSPLPNPLLLAHSVPLHLGQHIVHPMDRALWLVRQHVYQRER